jgi:hypothetical protein
MSTFQSPQALNRQLARKLNEDARTNPQSPYAGKFVGIANGQVVAVCDSLDEMARLLRKAEPDPEKTFWIEASADYDAVDQVWSLR